MKRVSMQDVRKTDYYYEEAIKTLLTNIKFAGKDVKTVSYTHLVQGGFFMPVRRRLRKWHPESRVSPLRSAAIPQSIGKCKQVNQGGAVRTEGNSTI